MNNREFYASGKCPICHDGHGETAIVGLSEDGFTIRVRSLTSTKELATIEVEKELLVVGPTGDVRRYDTL